MNTEKILILGVGNILLSDEGIGVHAVKALEENYHFPENVSLLDGGTLGLMLMDHLLGLDRLIVLDAVRGGHEPGSVYRLEDEGLRKSQGFSDSMHQLDLLDTLSMYEITEGGRPQTVVFGLEPQNMDDLGLELTPTARQALPKLCAAVVEELRGLGCVITARD